MLAGGLNSVSRLAKRAAEEHEEQTIDSAQYNTALLSLGDLIPVIESLDRPTDTDKYTIQSDNAIRNNEIWDFKNREGDFFSF